MVAISGVGTKPIFEGAFPYRKYSSFLLDSIFTDREQSAKKRQKVKIAQFS